MTSNRHSASAGWGLRPRRHDGMHLLVLAFSFGPEGLWLNSQRVHGAPVAQR